MKGILKFAGFAAGIGILGMALAVLHNNFGDSSYTREDLKTALSRSIEWMQQNNTTIQNDHNLMLWWFVEQATHEQDDPALKSLLAQYKASNVQRHEHSVFSYLFSGQRNPYISARNLVDLPYYNVYFIYGFSCSRGLVDEPLVQQQEDTGFCWRHYPISPACITHQMMGFRFKQRTGCDDQTTVANNIESLSKTIQTQSTFDFRVVDVYLQRVLMQLDSGNQARVKPRWIKRILQQQNPDGGWADFQPIFPVGAETYFGFKSNGLGVDKRASSFHPTAQAVWLLAMLLNRPIK